MTAALGLSAGWFPARADVWRFHGGAGANVGQADNPQFLSTTNPNYDPNAPVCDPNDPSYDPGDPVCQPTTSRRGRARTFSGSLTLNGGVSGTWATSAFDIAYMPSANYYKEPSNISNVGHRLTSSWRHDYSPRTTMNLTEYLTYTPEQNLDPNQLQGNNVIVERTRTTISNFRGSLAFEKSAKTTLTWTYRYQERQYSDETFIDSANHAAGMSYRRRFGRRSSFTTGYEYGLFSYKGRFPGAEHHTANVGYGLTAGHGFHTNMSLGYDVLSPDDPDQKSADGLFASAEVGYRMTTVSGTLGYSQGIRDGGGAFAASRAGNTYGNVHWDISRTLAADLAATYAVNSRVSATTGTVQNDETIRTFNGRSSLSYAISDAWHLTAAYTHYRQGTPSSATGVPDLRSNRYSLGISWSYR